MENEIEFKNENQQQENNFQNPTSVIAQENINESHNPALHLFLYLVSFFSLASFSFGVGAILFQFINKIFSNGIVSSYRDYFAQPSVKYGIASIIIAMPLYFVLMYFIAKYLYEGKIREGSGIRKWLTYIILFFTSATIIGDLITLVFRMLDGDIMFRFILKVFVVFLIAGFIFVYYILDMKKRNMIGKKYIMNKVFFFSGIIISCIALGLGFTIIDSPFVSRDKKIDEKTVSNVRNYNNQITNYYRNNGVLPENLEDLKNGNDSYYTGTMTELIDYKKINSTNYNLCADFKRSSSDYKNEREGYLYGYNNEKDWEYEKGNFCFEKNIKNITVNRNIQSVNNSIASEEAMKKSKIASIRSAMNSSVPKGILCLDAGGEIISGQGGGILCKNGENKTDLSWEKIVFCGANNENTKWTVEEGNSDKWKFYLTCSDIPDCNGPINAICNSKGCNFKGNCGY